MIRTESAISNPEPAIVAGELLVTRGAPQIVVHRCPRCSAAHRHYAAGLRVGACGCAYIVRLAA